jgi:hypothetical protein
MAKTLYSFALIAILAITFSACKKSILDEDEEGTLTAKNVRVQIFPYVGNYLYSSDSLYYLGGAFLKIDDIRMIHSNFYFVNAGDTLTPGDPVEYQLSDGKQDVYLYQLISGSYSGVYKYLIGLPPNVNAKAPSAQPEGSILKDNTLYRGAGKGYNFVTITGRIQDPAKPGSEPTIPLKWVIATDDLALEYGQAKSFNAVTGKPISFGVIFKLDKLFTGLSPLVNPTINSDPANPNDYTLAETLADNFVQAYVIQL